MKPVARQAKAIVALLLVAIGEALTYGVIPDRWRGPAQVVVAVAAYAGVYGTRNAPVVPPKL